MPRPSGPRPWLRPTEINAKTGAVERHAQWYVKDDGDVRIPSGCFAYPVTGLRGADKAEVEARNAEERARFDVFLANYIKAKYAPSVQKGRAASDILVTDVLLLYGEKVVMAKAARAKAADPNAGVDRLNRRGKPVKAHYEVTADKAMARLVQVAVWWQGKALADVDADACEAYVAWRCDHAWKSARPEATGVDARKVTSKGARRELEDMRAAVTWHRKRGYCREFVEVTLPSKSKPKVTRFSRHEAARLLLGMWRRRETMTVKKGSARAGEKVVSKKRPHAHLVRFTLLAIYTGTRAGAVATAGFEPLPGRSWLDLETGLFHRLAVGREESNKRQTPVRIPDRLLAHIRRWVRLGISRDYVVEYNGAAVVQVNKGFGVAVEAAGLKGTPHTCRHTCATWLLERGVKSWDAANYLGVSEKVLLETYAHWQADFQSAVTGGRRLKREIPPPGLHDVFSTNYNRDQDLAVAMRNRDARLARLGLPLRSLATARRAA